MYCYRCGLPITDDAPGQEEAFDMHKGKVCVKLLRAENERLRAEVQTYKDKERFYAEDDQQVRCGECGKPMQHVRPGKWQCDNCEATALAHHALTGE